MGWGGSAAATAAAAHTQAACGSSDASSAAAGVLLLPVLTVLQKMHFSEAHHTFLHAAGRRAAAEQQPGDAAAASARLLQSYMQALQDGSATSQQAPAVRMAALQALSQLLQVCSGAVTATAVADSLADATQRVMLIQRRQQQACGAFKPPVFAGACSQAAKAAVTESSSSAGAGSSSTPAASASSAATAVQLPPLQNLLSLLQPALAASELPALQAAALQLLHAYLQAGPAPEQLLGCRQQLQGMLALICAPGQAVRDAALALVPLCLQPAVLEAAFGGGQPAPPRAATAEADADEAAAALPQRQLLQLLEQLLESASSNATAPDAAVASRTALLRALAGLYAGLVGSGSEELPLLLLLKQVTGQHAQVRRRGCNRSCALVWHALAHSST
jgi:hypothetical protein